MTEATEPAARSPEDKQLAEELVERAKSDGVELAGPDGLLAGLTKDVLEAGLEAEMSEHLGYDKHDPAGRNKGNSRNGARAKKVLTDVGPVEVEVPCDRQGSFEPQLVKKHQRRLRGLGSIRTGFAVRHHSAWSGASSQCVVSSCRPPSLSLATSSDRAFRG